MRLLPPVRRLRHVWCDRSGEVEDPAGNSWWFSTHVEDVGPEEPAAQDGGAEAR